MTSNGTRMTRIVVYGYADVHVSQPHYSRYYISFCNYHYTTRNQAPAPIL